VKESYLKHFTIAVIGTGCIMVVLFSPDVMLRSNAMIVLSGIVGYVFKNGSSQAHVEPLRRADSR
jgi:hypothetical protein